MTSVQAVEVLATLAAFSAAIVPGRASAAGDPELQGELQQVARRRIYFGHQSVGANLIEGIRELAAREGVPVRFMETLKASDVSPATFGHGKMAENGAPSRKLESFEEALASGADVDIALIKFCYDDIDERTDVGALFTRYQATLTRLKAKFPRTIFVHVTVPLTVVQGGPRALVKRLLGREPAGLAENARREEFNGRLRQAPVGSDLLFDLARVESTAPDGRRASVDRRGRAVPVLVGSYTSDGGHLSAEGRSRAAREFVSVLAQAARRGESTAR